MLSHCRGADEVISQGPLNPFILQFSDEIQFPGD